MAHAPQHPENPCSLDDQERTPGKIWDLLRLNDSFKKTVARLEELDKRPRSTDRVHRSPSEIGSAMVERLGELHSFAAVALQWLVPDPLFAVRHVALPANLDLTGKRFVSLVTVKLQEGTTADPSDEAHWRTFEGRGDRDAESFANFHGRPLRRGPHIELQRSEDPRFCSKVDPLKEWSEYFANGQRFTLNTPWRASPAQFRREFSFEWRRLDSRAMNPITGTRTDSPHQQETNFFQGWDLFASIGRNKIDQESLARVFMFNDFGENYRVFAFPNSIRTRSEARRMADWLFDQLAADLPPREPEMYGSPLQWDILLTVQDLMKDGAPFEEALQESFELIHLKPDTWPEGEPIPDQKKGWAQRGADWLSTYRVMDAPLARDGLVQRIFPGLPKTVPSAGSR